MPLAKGIRYEIQPCRNETSSEYIQHQQNRISPNHCLFNSWHNCHTHCFKLSFTKSHIQGIACLSIRFIEFWFRISQCSVERYGHGNDDGAEGNIWPGAPGENCDLQEISKELLAVLELVDVLEGSVLPVFGLWWVKKLISYYVIDSRKSFLLFSSEQPDLVVGVPYAPGPGGERRLMYESVWYFRRNQ